MNNDNNAIATSHIPARTEPDGTITALCGLVFKDTPGFDREHDPWVSCPLCELAWELRDTPPWDAGDTETTYDCKCFTAAVKSFCDFQHIPLRQIAERARIPLSTFYSRTSGRSVWNADEINRIIDVLKSTPAEAKSRRS